MRIFCLVLLTAFVLPAGEYAVDIVCISPDVDMLFVVLPGGPFMMGSKNGYKDERPVHEVHLSAFCMGMHEVTNLQYATFMNLYGADRDSFDRHMVYPDRWGMFKEDGTWKPRPGYENHPAVCVTWYGALQFCQYLGLRLPTEAEWEYACRAGNPGKYGFGNVDFNIRDYAWYRDNSKVGGILFGRRQPHQVGTRKGNAFGLFDMHGNVWEWCSDWYAPDYYTSSPPKDPQGPDDGEMKVIRGGSFHYQADALRSANRNSHKPFNWLYNVGFRCVKDYVAQAAPDSTE